MNYHFLPDDKYVEEFIQSSEKVGAGICRYYIITENAEVKWVQSKETLSGTISILSLNEFIGSLQNNDRIFFHSINEAIVGAVLEAKPGLEFFWVVWGWDLYDRLRLNILEPYDRIMAGKTNKWINTVTHFSRLVFNLFKSKSRFRLFLNRLKGILHYNEYDVRLLNQSYGTSVPRLSFFYKNVVDWAQIDRAEEERRDKGLSEQGTIKLLLGNSATASNNHFSIIEKLQHSRFSNILLYTPLSYGPPEYRDRVVEFGKGRLGSRFIPMVDFISPSEYSAFLVGLDGAIMNHIRSQAMGNIVSLIYAGKMLFLNKKCSTTRFLNGLGIKFYLTEDLDTRNLSDLKLLPEEMAKNKQLLIDFFSDRQQLNNLSRIYKETT